MELFQKLFTRRVAVRLVGVTVVNLDLDRRQNELFDHNANRRWYLNRGVDKCAASVSAGNSLLLMAKPAVARALRQQAGRAGAVDAMFIAIAVD